MINNTTLVGRLTKDPELRYTNSGIAVTSFTIAVERNYTNAQGERETDFITCQSWRGTAEIIANLGVKGALVGIAGSIQTRNYENNQGQNVYVTEIIVDNFQMLEPKNVTDERRSQSGQSNSYSGQGSQNQGQQTQSKGQTNNNAGQWQTNDDPFASNDDVTEIDDSDLPF